MLNDWHQEFPGRIESMFTAMQNVVPSHLCDNELFNFSDINSNSGVINGGDTAFDEPELNFNGSAKETKIPTNKAEQVTIIEVQ